MLDLHIGKNQKMNIIFFWLIEIETGYVANQNLD